MLQTDNFTMRMSPQDKAMLARIARRFQRSQADTIKTLVREVYQLMMVQEAKDNQLEPQVQPMLGD